MNQCNWTKISQIHYFLHSLFLLNCSILRLHAAMMYLLFSNENLHEGRFFFSFLILNLDFIFEFSMLAIN